MKIPHRKKEEFKSFKIKKEEKRGKRGTVGGLIIQKPFKKRLDWLLVRYFSQSESSLGVILVIY